LIQKGATFEAFGIERRSRYTGLKKSSRRNILFSTYSTTEVFVLKKIRRSVCPYDRPDAYGLLVEAVEGKAIKVTGDADHPFTRGTLCPKMNRYQDTVHEKEREIRFLVYKIINIFSLHQSCNRLLGRGEDSGRGTARQDWLA